MVRHEGAISEAFTSHHIYSVLQSTGRRNTCGIAAEARLVDPIQDGRYHATIARPERVGFSSLGLCDKIHNVE